jgi:L-aminopeptidase/D-esterase-like protein
MDNSITDIKGLLVGHAQNNNALTGCTVVICENGAIGGISQRGGAPGTRETDLLRPMHMIQNIHGVLLTGGSAFGLDAAGGVMEFLEEKNIGFNAGKSVVPIVPSAVLFDLSIGDHTIRPDKAMGFEACKNASSSPPLQGNYGAGIGATVGKILGNGQMMKSGIGTASMDLGNNVVIGALVAVNAFGDVIREGNIIAGARSIRKGPLKIGKGEYFADTLEVMRSFPGKKILAMASKQNTVIGVIATNAKFNKEEVNYFAEMASTGIANSIRPSFTMFDGDTIFGLATGQVKSDLNLVSAFAPNVFSDAIYNAITHAESLGGIPSYKTLI